MSLQESLSFNLKTMNKVMLKSVSDGHTQHREKSIEEIGKLNKGVEQKIKKIEKLYANITKDSEDAWMKFKILYQKYYKCLAIWNILFALSIVLLVLITHAVITNYTDPRSVEAYTSFFSLINVKFYEAAFQAILALVVALFIGKSINVEKIDSWKSIENVITGLLWAVFGVISAMLILAGVNSNAPLFIFTLISILILFYKSILPLFRFSQSRSGDSLS